ncbi:hypothetical protein [Mesotoga prima]|mgnify:CR=1 FL=1|uniref:hypothetical protein n=1 Tax=Mesotoga prima TaxID=1184387 RepID=UPI002596D19F|nr:hypothetical protein [Mesotoga prima]HNQ71369.1 hypothetical protein [Mesotoga prima]HNS76181.1 hypothetical protein [Mesotoga prima]
MRIKLRLFFVCSYLLMSAVFFSFVSKVTSINDYSSIYEEESGYRVDISYPGPQLFWTLITLDDNRDFFKRVYIVDQSASVHIEHVPRQMDITIDSFSGDKTVSVSKSIFKKAPKSDLSFLLLVMGIPIAALLAIIGVVIMVRYNRKILDKASRILERSKTKDAIGKMESRRTALIALWFTVLVIGVGVIGVSYYLGLFPSDPVITQEGALSFPDERPNSLPEAEFSFLKETFNKLSDGGPKVIERYFQLNHDLEEVKKTPIQNEEKSKTISRIVEELEKIDPAIYQIVEALQTIKLKVINGQITSNEDKKEIDRLLITMDEINKEPPAYNF